MNSYADTSFLFSLFVPDVNSPRAVRALQSISSPVVFSSLHQLEMENALALAVFQRRITREKLIAAQRRVQQSLASGTLLAVEVRWDVVFDQATTLAGEWTAEVGSRSLDLLQVATAIYTCAEVFLSFDKRQCLAAQKAGLNVHSMDV